jgi:Rod binding domain-containing protein
MQVSAISSSTSAMPLAASGLLGQAGLMGSTGIKAGQSPAEQRHAAAVQFEAIMLRQFLQQSVGSLAGTGESGGNGVYGYLLTDVLASKLADGGGLGLAGILERQLTPRGTSAAASTIPSSSSTSSP